MPDRPLSATAVMIFSGDSALKLILRCYVPDMDGRVGIISDLHTTIHERFGEAGIEISFPQQDLHLRSVDAGALSILVPKRDEPKG